MALCLQSPRISVLSHTLCILVCPLGVDLQHLSDNCMKKMLITRAYLRGGGSGGSNPPPPKFSDFFLKSEGKEIERKRKKRDVGGGGLPLNILLRLRYFQGGGGEKFSGG